MICQRLRLDGAGGGLSVLGLVFEGVDLPGDGRVVDATEAGGLFKLGYQRIGLDHQLFITDH